MSDITEEKDSIQISDKVEILSTEDDKIKTIGEILSSDSSRDIMKLLFNDSMTANQIATKTSISLPLVIYHLKKMQDAGVVKITNVGKNVKSHDMKFYTVDKLAIVILPNQMSAPAKKSKSLFQSFSRIHRLSTLGTAAIAAWFVTGFLQQFSKPVETINNIESAPQMKAAPMMEAKEAATSTGPADLSQAMPSPDAGVSAASSEPLSGLALAFIVALCVVVTGLVIEIIIQSKKEKKKV